MGSWCKFCNAKTGCPEYGNKVTTLVEKTRDQMEAELAQWLPYADMMIEWGEHVKQAAHKLLEQGGAVPGWKLVPKRATRSWANEDEAQKYLTEAGLGENERFTKKFISPTQAETALKRLGVGKMPEHLVDKTSTGTTLAREDDPRAALPIAPDAFRLLADRLSAKS
jgi:hypothetical protein